VQKEKFGLPHNAGPILIAFGLVASRYRSRRIFLLKNPGLTDGNQGHTTQMHKENVDPLCHSN